MQYLSYKPGSWLGALALLASVMLSGCATLVGSATQNLADSLSSSILNSNDPATVAQGLPAYLLLLDGLLADDPDNAGMLRASAELNSAYAGVFAREPGQAGLLASKALGYARRAFCQANSTSCYLETIDFKEFETRVAAFGSKDIDFLYTLGSTWTGWIDAHSNDWNAVAQIDRAKMLLQRVVSLEDDYNEGFAHIYLGSLATLLPPALGGKPEIGKYHFERAIAISDGANLMAQVSYAQRYARLLFERELHDRLLKQVLASESKVDGLTLSNTLAKQQAGELLDSADEYF